MVSVVHFEIFYVHELGDLLQGGEEKRFFPILESVESAQEIGVEGTRVPFENLARLVGEFDIDHAAILGATRAVDEFLLLEAAEDIRHRRLTQADSPSDVGHGERPRAEYDSENRELRACEAIRAEEQPRIQFDGTANFS